MSAIVEFKNVSYWYPDSQKPALQNLDVKIDSGEFILIVGSSGSGKSTFCRCFNGLVPYFAGGRFSGEVTVDGLKTTEHETSELAKHVGLVFQDPENQFVMTSVENEIAFGMENTLTPPAEIRGRIKEAADKLQIQHLLNRRTDQLSTGEKQKIILASTIAMKPPILVLDEPTSQLDPKSAEQLMTTLSELNKEDTTVVITEHRISRVKKYARRVLDLDSKKFKTSLAVVHSQDGGSLRNPNEPTPVERKTVISLKGVTKRYGSILALDNVSLNVYENEFLALMGFNGSGKTTLAKHMNGLLKPDEGVVTLFGVDARKIRAESLTRKVSYLSQNPNEYLFSETVEEELEFTMKNYGIKADVDGMLAYLGLLEHKKSYPRDLSGGERQKTALASLLIGDPQVVILDEPTRGVDPESKMRLMQLLKHLSANGKTIVLVTHDVESAVNFADRIALMDQGRISAEGPAQSILKNDFFKVTE